METPICDEYKEIVSRFDAREEKAIGQIEHFAFYEEAKTSYAIIAKGNTFTVNRKSVIIGKRNILGTTLVFLTVVPTRMIAGTNRDFGLLERTAVFLPCSAVIVGFTVLVHGKPRFAKVITGRKLFRIFGISFIKRYSAITVVSIFNGIINFFYVVSLICYKDTFVNR